MVSNGAANRTVKGVTLLVWAAAAASAAYWGLKVSGGDASGPVAAAGLRQPAPADPAAIARLLGASGGAAAQAASPQPSAASRFQLVGVVADKSQHGAALIVVDGKPAKHYRIGARVDEGLVLQSVQPRRAVLAPSMQGEPAITLELPVPN